MNIVLKVIFVAILSTLIEQLVKKYIAERLQTKDSINLFSIKSTKKNKDGTVEKTFSIKI